MSIASETHKVIYVCDGATTEFDYTFKIFDEDELEVVLKEIATGTETVLTISTHYTVDDVGVDAGGTVTTIATYSGDYKLILRRKIAYTQTADYIANDDFPAETHEEALDRIVMMVQQLDEQMARAVIQDSEAVAQIEFPALSSGFLYCDGSVLSFASALTTTAYPGNISAGDDADKAAYPGVKDIYFALDTGTIYYCGVAGTWTEFTPTVGAFTFTIDGAGSEIGDGIKGDIYIPFDCTLTGWVILADQSGAIKVDVWKQVYASFPPTNTESICNGHEPEIAASAVKAADADISDWTTVTCAAGDVIRFNVDSCTTITRVTISLTFTR